MSRWIQVLTGVTLEQRAVKALSAAEWETLRRTIPESIEPDWTGRLTAPPVAEPAEAEG